MSIGNVNNNNAAQLQLYAQEKAAVNGRGVQEVRNTVAQQTNNNDSVQISERAKALLAREEPVTTLGNGEGIEPPKTISGNGEGIEPPVTLGNGEGIEPPVTLGNGEGIEPPNT